jgi:hypothetical protein
MKRVSLLTETESFNTKTAEYIRRREDGKEFTDSFGHPPFAVSDRVHQLQQANPSKRPSLCRKRHHQSYPFVNRTEILRRMLYEVWGTTAPA